MRPARGLDLIPTSSLKAFGVGLHGILEFRDRFPSVREIDMRVVCYGCGDGRHIPFLVSLFPDLKWEIYTPENKPLQIKHVLNTNLNIHRRCGTLHECFDDIWRRRSVGEKVLMFVDLNMHLTPQDLNAMNKIAVKPTVFSENRHFQIYTLTYKNACAMADRNADILMLSMPLRLPWVTHDFEQNKRRAAWLSKDLDENVMLYPSVEMFPQFASRPKSSELRALYLTANAKRDMHIEWKRYDHEAESVDWHAKNTEKLDFMLALIDRCDAYLGAREKTHGNHYLHAWSRIFVEDSKKQLLAQKNKIEPVRI
jgi:hypothetical protein